MDNIGKKSRQISETTLIKNGAGSVAGIIVNSHTSGTVKLVDGLANGVQASGVLTSSGAMVPAEYATNTLTSNATNVSDGDTVTMGATVYRFKDTPAQAYDVQIGANASASLDNLKSAVNGTGTSANYFTGTVAHPDIVAGAKTATTIKFWSRVIGTANNTKATTDTATTLSWADTTLGGGTGVSDPGVTDAGAFVTIDTVTYTFTKQLAEEIGLASVANQIKWVTSEAVALDNLKAVINQSGIAGTDYSSASVEHPTVYATTNTATAQTVVAKKIGTNANSIVTTDTLANYAWGAGTLESGTGSDGRVLTNTITLSAVATTGERFIPLFNLEFYTGLLAVIGGTADITIVYNN